MKRLVEYFVKYPIWANAIIATVLLFGLGAFFFQLNKSFFPERELGSISVSVFLPGAAPEEMEEGVTIKIEEAIKGIEGIDEVRSTSSENNATINISLFKDYDAESVLTEVKNAVDQINSFPVSAERPIIFEVEPRSRAANLLLSGDVELKTLKDFAEKIESELLASGEISKVDINGYPDLEVSIEVTEERLRRFGLTFDQVANAVRNNNRDISAGSIKSTEEEILIRSRAKTTDAGYIGDIVLRANPDGSKLLLRDVAQIKEQFADTPNELYVNGKRAVSFGINKLPEEDLEAISEFVNGYVAEFNERYPGLNLLVSFDYFGLLDQRLNMLLSNGGFGLLLVLICLGMFLSLRLSFWVAWGIPASFLGMFFIGSLLGITINMISLFGMILVVGILVDDGIVIAENIFSHFEAGKSPQQAAVDGTMEVLPSVFTSVMTTIVAFIPLFYLEGFEFFEEMAIVVILSLAISLVEAFFVLPAHLGTAKVLKRREESNRIRGYLDDFINFLRHKVYGRALRHILQFRYVYVTTPLAFIFIIVGLVQGGLIKTTFFPPIAFDSFNVDVAFKAGTREDKVEDVLRKANEEVWKLNEEIKEEFQDSVDYISFALINMGRTSDGSEAGTHAGNLEVLLKDMDDRKWISSFEIANRLRRKLGSVPEAEKFQVAGRNRFGKPVSISLFSKNPEALLNAKEDLKKELNDFAVLKDVTDNAKLGRRELQIDLLPQAYFLGLTHQEITKQVRQGFFGEEVQRLQKGVDEMRVWVRYPESGRSSLGELEDVKIKVGNGGSYPINQLVDYKIERGIVDIKHYNGATEIIVEAELENENAAVPEILERVSNDIMPRLQAKYPSLEFDFGGQQKRSEKSMASFRQLIVPLLFVIILMLTLTFRSFSQAMLIMLMVPVGIACAVLGHGIEGKPVSLLSIWGVLALSGVIINDAVVLVAKYNGFLKQGISMKEAAYQAGVARFRPILLTSLTTVAGLFPLIREKSFQAQFLIPMGISVAYGVLFGTLFILLTFPVAITVLNDVRRGIKWLKGAIAAVWSGDYGALKVPTREEVEPAVIEVGRLRKQQDAQTPQPVS